MLTLEKGSRFDCLKTNTKPGKVIVKGGDIFMRDGKRYVDLQEPVTMVQIEKLPNTIYPLSVRATIPANAEKGEQFFIQVAQQNDQGQTVGGATMVYQVK